jgi:hypothetical protein
MQFSSSLLALLVSSLTASNTDAFTCMLRQPTLLTTTHKTVSRQPASSRQSITTPSARLRTTRPATPLFMGDFDFPSAMPEKPQLSLAEKMMESADNFIEMMTNALGEGVAPPPELKRLQTLRETETEVDVNELAVAIYDLMLERGMLYDEAPETGTLTPTAFNIKENLDVKEVKDEFRYLYKYGMNMMTSGLLSREQLDTPD